MKQYIALSILFGSAIACDAESEQERYDRKFQEGFRGGLVRKSKPTDFSRYQSESEPVIMPMHAQQGEKIGGKSLHKTKTVGVFKLFRLYSKLTKTVN